MYQLQRKQVEQTNLMKQSKKAKPKTQKVDDLKKLVAILSWIYVAAQVSGGDTTEFFSQEKSTKSTVTFKRWPDLADEHAAVSPPSLSPEQPRSNAFVPDGPALFK